MEIAQVLSLDSKDSKHFAERVRMKLNKWGYGFEYSRIGVKITRVPTTPEDKLKEILIRELNLDVQICAYAFSCFLCSFTVIENFDSMPWEERALVLKEKYGVTATDRTLRNWCSILIKYNIVQRCERITCWKTEWINNVKSRTMVAADDTVMEEYFQKRDEYLRKEGAHPDWKKVYHQLWNEYHCCYYYCRGWVFNAIEEECFAEILELTHEICCKGIELPNEITRKEDFEALWYTK